MEVGTYIVVILADLRVRSRDYFSFCWSAQFEVPCDLKGVVCILAGLRTAFEVFGTLARFAFVVCFGAWGGLTLPDT